jgi:hypothetical protein
MSSTTAALGSLAAPRRLSGCHSLARALFHRAQRPQLLLDLHQQMAIGFP